MDPNACWCRINSILNSGEDIEDAVPHIVALAGWLDMGGFKPRDFNEELFDSMCGWVKSGHKLSTGVE